MSETISAVFENGTFRPLSSVDLKEGEEVEVILVRRNVSDPARSKNVLTKIAELPLEGESTPFSGSDHDSLLYSDTEQ